MAVSLPRKGLTTEGVYEAFTRVLAGDSIRAAAAKVSKRIRSRKRTPLQETAGELHCLTEKMSWRLLADFCKHTEIC
jgi:hypothetical protein